METQKKERVAKKYVNNLAKKVRSKNAKWIDNNFFNPDELTLTMFSSYLKEGISKLRHVQMLLADKGYQPQFDFSDLEVRLDMSVEEFSGIAKDKVDSAILDEMVEFSKKDKEKYDFEGKNILAVLWANLIDNALNKTTETNSSLIDVFFAIQKKLNGNPEVDINDLLDEAISIFKEEGKIVEYMNLVYVDIQSENGWYDYNTFPPKSVKDEMNFDLTIENTDELLNALKDFKNLPSVVEYIKNTYFSSKEDKKDKYIREYKALALVLNILEDKQFAEDEDFDKDDNIGQNLNSKLYANEEFIRQNHVNYKNSDILSGFKSQSKKIANSMLGKTNVYGVWKKVTNAYIKQCSAVATKVKKEEITPTTRKYLKALGLVGERETIKNTQKLFIELKKKCDEARKLLPYLTNKQIKKLEADPFIDDAEGLYEELTSWAMTFKGDTDKTLTPAKLQIQGLSPKLKELVAIAKRQPKTLQPSGKKPKSSASGEQISLFDDESELN